MALSISRRTVTFLLLLLLFFSGGGITRCGSIVAKNIKEMLPDGVLSIAIRADFWQPQKSFILGSVFSDCVVFYGEYSYSYLPTLTAYCSITVPVRLMVTIQNCQEMLSRTQKYVLKLCRERNCADTIGTVLVPWASHFQC